MDLKEQFNGNKNVGYCLEADLSPKVYFIFPVYNEALNIPRIAQDLPKLTKIVSSMTKDIEFLFIDDGSHDNTFEILNKIENHPIKILKHVQNLGPGYAFRTAFSYLIANNIKYEDVIITLEGDATSDPFVLARMLKRMEEGDDIILASPYLYGGGFISVQPYRLFLSHIANFLFKLILNVHGLATFSCFYRLYRGSALLKLNAEHPNSIITSPGFDCAAEIIIKSVRAKLSISEVPFLVDWSKRKGKSKMKIIKTTFSYLKLFVKFSYGKTYSQKFRKEKIEA